MRVPVLSRHTVSTLASDSTALNDCTSMPRPDSLTAATANVRLISRTRPSGTRVTMPAVAVAAAERKRRWWAISTHTNAAPSGSMTAVVTSSSRLICCSSGERR